MQRFSLEDPEHIEELKEAIRACKRYFEYCQEHSIAANHESSDSEIMQTRLQLRKDAERRLDEVLFP